ncbi:hypothetical protein EDD86DRAFT_252460 [Gorgonomyces haynaldii]|nr:hypothetical protein EDD86DRAFT_252460 [Gorgonomyces haynaldii]
MDEFNWLTSTPYNRGSLGALQAVTTAPPIPVCLCEPSLVGVQILDKDVLAQESMCPEELAMTCAVWLLLGTLRWPLRCSTPRHVVHEMAFGAGPTRSGTGSISGMSTHLHSHVLRWQTPTDIYTCCPNVSELLKQVKRELSKKLDQYDADELFLLKAPGQLPLNQVSHWRSSAILSPTLMRTPDPDCQKTNQDYTAAINNHATSLEHEVHLAVKKHLFRVLGREIQEFPRKLIGSNKKPVQEWEGVLYDEQTGTLYLIEAKHDMSASDLALFKKRRDGFLETAKKAVQPEFSSMFKKVVGVAGGALFPLENRIIARLLGMMVCYPSGERFVVTDSTESPFQENKFETR